MTRWFVFILLLSLSAQAERVIQFGAESPRHDGVEILQDGAASNGLAYRMPKGTAGSIHFGYSWETMGLYEATFYLMTDDTSITEPVIRIRYTCETTRFPNPPAEMVTHRDLAGTDFATANTWQPFTLTWISPQVARNGYQIIATGAAGVAIDRIQTRLVRPVTETELRRYLDIADPPAPTSPPIGPRKIHLMLGAFADYWLVDWALARLRGAAVTRSSWATGGQCQGQPLTPADLYRYDAVVMVGTDIRHLPLAMRPAYVKWVEAGGCLLLLGGPYGFGQSGIGESSLAPALPVELTGAFDLRRETQPLLGTDPAITEILNAETRTAVTFFRHAVEPRPGATVWLGTDEAPLLVSAPYGRGTVIAGCFAPMGEASAAADGQVAFWDDSRLSRILATVLQHSMRPRETTPWRHWTPPATPTADAKAVIEATSGGMAALEADLLGDDDGGDTQALNATQANILIKGGGRPAVPILLQAMATMTDQALIRQGEYAIRPHLRPADAALVRDLVESPHQIVRESGVALIGISHPTPPDDFAGRLGIQDRRLLRSALRSVREGDYRSYLPRVKALHQTLQAAVYDKRDRLYDGYWYQGFLKQDPIWPYTEATLTLVSAGESAYLGELTELYLLLHLHHLRMRSFIYLYNEKVPREAEAMKQHRLRNRFLQPELSDALAQIRLVLSHLPASSHGAFREQVLATHDLELLRLLLYPAYDLAGHTPDATWTAFLRQLDRHVLHAALTSDRL